MDIKKQVSPVHMAIALDKHGLLQKSAFVWAVLPDVFAACKVYDKRGNCGLIESDTEAAASIRDKWAAYTVTELALVLTRYMPSYIAIWEEWGYRDCGGTGRGYGSLIDACCACLEDLLENKKLSIEECNAIIEKHSPQIEQPVSADAKSV